LRRFQSEKDTLFWLSVGLGFGLVVSASLTYRHYNHMKRRREDPRLEQAELLLEEAEALLKSARRGKVVRV
jgi:hypothetical protein